ncbi:MAG: prepilin-type N-terminal cleavage/methylation domain-containing protein [Candidatus Marinimicrobia bacterium]|nr:prepilin-type N-terminal cleavage/methylation domain-containing protein [Candidatus Neomarinimicrobiota bacterium]MCF7923080.1 prepilin-type N-terminal cleavage/methylation domain-containing protein [Candidatus Neomarinimicrobiota bacterium]
MISARATSRNSARAGFSLVELMIIILIIGVLAGVAVPIYRGGIERAIRAEGEAALGSIRTQVRAYYGEWGEYPIADLSQIMTQDWHDIKAGELDGTNFTELSYYYQCTDGKNYLIGVHRGTVMKLHRSLNQDGVYEDWDVNVDE